jgi:ABC-2 type transport system ATP-binding protein
VSERPVIELHKFSKWYGRIIAVNDMSLNIGRGVTGLLGPNGAGKTSLLRCISGQTRPNLGAVRVLGENPWRNPDLFRNIGLCTDQGWLMEELTPKEMLIFDLRIRGAEESKLEEMAIHALAQFDLQHVVDRRINTLSRGTKQRVKLAQAFAYDPDVLLLDEPLTGIDPVARATTVKRIKERGDAGRCVLLSSHVLHEVESMTDQVLLLHKGRLVAHGNAMEIRDLLDKHPHRIAVECDRPRDLAKAMVDLPSVQGISFPGDSWVEFHTLHPDECYGSVPKIALEANINVRRLTSPDASLEMLFRYLVGEGA